MEIAKRVRKLREERDALPVPDLYTIPEMEMTPDRGTVRITMRTGERPGAYTLLTRPAARHLLWQLALGVPEWLIDD